MDFFRKIIGKFQPKKGPSEPLDLIYIFLPESLEPLERGARYEDAIEAELQLSGLGFISGGGSLMSDEREDGARTIESCGIDVDTGNVDAARDLLRRHLPELGCQAGTQLHYREAGMPLQDEFDGEGWQLRKARSFMHPGFGI